MPNRNTHWASLIVEELIRLDCTTFFLAPGARSTPLTSAAGRHPGARVILHYDERGTAFAALGYGKASGRPAAWITTSGTAVANGLPAIVEASLEGVPVILLTGDRPPELRDTASNQTIRQPGIFSSFVRYACDLPTPTSDISPTFVLTTVDQAFSHSLGPSPGPVHLNCMFRKPLESDPMSLPDVVAECTGDGRAGRSGAISLSRWLSSGKPYTAYDTVGARGDSSSGLPAPFGFSVSSGFSVSKSLSDRVMGASRPLVIAGRLGSSEIIPALFEWGERNSVPVLPDILSFGRFGPASDVSVGLYDLILGDGEICDSVVPDLVLQVGRPSVSKRLSTWLAAVRPESYAVLSSGLERIDPAHQVTDRVTCSDIEVMGLFSDDVFGATPDAGWLDTWTAASHRAGAWLKTTFGDKNGNDLSEQGIAWRLGAELTDDDLLVLGNSMSVRHMNTFAPCTGASVNVYGNRGASGIDGTLATAAGIGRHDGRRMTVLLGDLALLHDLNSLSLLKDSGAIIVVLNNDGGGIFSHLPISNQQDVFDPYFSTPHGYSFEGTCRQFSLEYRQVTSLEDFSRQYRDARSSSHTTLMEVRTSRAETCRFNARLLSTRRK